MSLGSRLDTLGQHGFVSYVYQFIGIFRHMYTQLLSLGLGTPSFVHGTLGDVVGNSGSPAWNHRSSQLYRVPT